MENSQTVSHANYSVSTPVTDDGLDAADRITYVTSRAVFAVILAGGLVANCVTIVHMVRGQRRLGSRAPPQLSLFVVAIHTTANLVNCLANGVWMVYTAATAGRQPDAYETTGCRLDAAAVQMIVIVHALGLALMSVDRLAAVRSAGHGVERRGFMLSRAALLIALAWLYSIGLSIPLLVAPNGIGIEEFSKRYLCTVDSNAPAAYVWTTMMIGYVCPIGVVVAMFIGTAMSATQHRRKLAASRVYAGSIPVTGPADAESNQQHPADPAVGLSVEVNAAKYVACLFAAWCVFVLPFPVLSLVRIGRTAVASRLFTYARDVDAIVTWLFISHPVLLPAITLVWRKNVCCRCVHRLGRCCRDATSTDDVGSNSPTVTPKRRHQRLGEVHPFYISPGRLGATGGGSGFEATGGGIGDGRPVPVLFATPHGLHIRSSSAPTGLLPDPAGSKDQLVPAFGEEGDEARKCDVFGSVYALQTDDDDLLNTSDYDSGEEDPVVVGVGESARSGPRAGERRPFEVRALVPEDPDDDAQAASKSSQPPPATAEPNRVSCGIGEQRSAGKSIWYVDEVDTTRCETRVDRLIDSGVGTMKKPCIDGQSAPKETSFSTSADVQSQPAAAAAQTSSSNTKEPAQTEAAGAARPRKKKPKTEDGRSTRKVADADRGRKEVGNERAKSAKAVSRTADSRSKRTDDSSPPRADQPLFRSLPKIVITGVADGEDASSSLSCECEEISSRRRRRQRKRRKQ